MFNARKEKMTTDLGHCNKDIYENGVLVFLTHTLPAKLVEEFVVKVREDCGEAVDWHYAAGRARILTTGDPAKVRESILKYKDFHDAAYRTKTPKHPQEERAIIGIWSYNNM